MTALRLEKVSFAYPGGSPLLEAATLQLTPGWTGIVGANGAGKTTLLEILTGKLTPTMGHVAATSLTLLHCSQRLDSPDEHVLELARDWGRRGCRVRNQLRLEPEMVERWTTLSPGEQRRWQLAGALHAEPDVLLLDEPTNHVDSELRQVLLTQLKRFRGIGVVVSHDRDLLDALCQQTIRMVEGNVTTWVGGYSAAAAQWALVEHEHELQRSQLRQTIQRVRATKQSLQERSQQGVAKDRAHRRLARPLDHDARETGRKVRAAKAASRGSRQRRVLNGREQQLKDQLSHMAPVRRLRDSRVFLDYVPAPKGC